MEQWDTFYDIMEHCVTMRFHPQVLSSLSKQAKKDKLITEQDGKFIKAKVDE
jgi:hypothetical protein